MSDDHVGSLYNAYYEDGEDLYIWTDVKYIPERIKFDRYKYAGDVILKITKEQVEVLYFRPKKEVYRTRDMVDIDAIGTWMNIKHNQSKYEKTGRGKYKRSKETRQKLRDKWKERKANETKRNDETSISRSEEEGTTNKGGNRESKETT